MGKYITLLERVELREDFQLFQASQSLIMAYHVLAE